MMAPGRKREDTWFERNVRGWTPGGTAGNGLVAVGAAAGSTASTGESAAPQDEQNFPAPSAGCARPHDEQKLATVREVYRDLGREIGMRTVNGVNLASSSGTVNRKRRPSLVTS